MVMRQPAAAPGKGEAALDDPLLGLDGEALLPRRHAFALKEAVAAACDWLLDLPGAEALGRLLALSRAPASFLGQGCCFETTTCIVSLIRPT